MGNLPDDFVFSQSSLQDYVDCPRRFELKYILRQRWPAPEVDDMLEFEKRMEQGQRFHQLVHQHLLGIRAEMLTQYINDDKVKTWFETYLNNGLKNVPSNRYPEQTLTVLIGQYAFLAKFDLVAFGDTVVIMDWKTSRNLPKREWLASKLQTIVYRYVLAKAGNKLNNNQPILPEKIEMRYWFANHNGNVFAFKYDAAQAQTDEQYLLDLAKEIDTRAIFPLTDDIHRCQFCAYRSLCDRGKSAGSLEEWELADYDDIDLTDFEIDIDQIAEIEF